MNYYKPSIFNYFQRVEVDGKEFNLIYNTLSRELLSISPTYQPIEFLATVRQPGEVKELFSRGFLVEDDTNEISVALNETEKKRCSDKRMVVTIIPTDACNFMCSYCYQSELSHFMDSLTCTSIIKWLDNALWSCNELYLSWFGGEPLLCKRQIVDMMRQVKEICKSHRVSFVSHITTNGYELDYLTFSELLKCNVLYYQITIDGNSETHNKQRPHKTKADSYERIINNLINIKERSHNKRFEIGIRINVSESMTNKVIRDFIDNMAILFGDDHRFVLIWQWVRDWGGTRILNKKDDLVLRDNNRCLEFAKEALDRGLLCSEQMSSKGGFDTCEAFYKNGYVINYDGRVMKCAMHMNNERNCIGHITNTGELVINQDEEGIWHRSPSIHDRCKECAFLPQCLSNRCFFAEKIGKKLKCVEYKAMVPGMLYAMIKKGKYISMEATK